jgi:hypothetical protein
MHVYDYLPILYQLGVDDNCIKESRLMRLAHANPHDLPRIQHFICCCASVEQFTDHRKPSLVDRSS